MGKKKEQSTGFFGNPRIGVPVGRSEDKQFGNTLKREFYSTREVHSVTSSSKGLTQTTKMFKDQLLGTQTYINKSNGAIQLKSETILPSAGLSVHVNHVTHNNVMKTTTFENGFPAQTKIFSSAGALLETQKHDIVTRGKKEKPSPRNETTLVNAQERLARYRQLEDFSDRAPPVPEHSQLGFIAKFFGMGG